MKLLRRLGRCGGTRAAFFAVIAGIVMSLPVRSSAETPDAALSTAPAITSILVEGNRSVSLTEIANRITVKPGTRWSAEQLQFSVETIQSIYRDSGFWEASVSTELWKT